MDWHREGPIHLKIKSLILNKPVKKREQPASANELMSVVIQGIQAEITMKLKRKFSLHNEGKKKNIIIIRLSSIWIGKTQALWLEKKSTPIPVNSVVVHS